MSISLVMLVKNPPMDRLAALVEYMQSVISETVIVDTGSHDRDKRLMSSLPNTRVIGHEWKDDFSEARNVGLKEALGDWTLVLDPDELPSFGMMGLLDASSFLIAKSQPRGFLIWTKNYWGGELGAERESDWHLRLFRTGSGRFYRPVHELVAIDGKPETETRGTPLVIKVSKNDYLIHSKPGDRLKVDADYYERLGGE